MADATTNPFMESKRGQNLVELALLLPILLIIVIGILDLGRSFYYYVAITNAAREGARYAAVHPGSGDPAVRTHVSNELSPAIMIDTNDVHVARTMVPGQPSEITVTIAYHFDLVAGEFWSRTLGWANPMTVSSTASMPVTSSF